MNHMVGETAAQVIETMAAGEKSTSESTFREKIQPAIRRELECPDAITLPERLVNGFTRSLKPNEDATRRILESLKLVAFAMANMNRDDSRPLPRWVKQVAAGDFGKPQFHESARTTTSMIQDMLDSIHKQQEVQEARREANLHRSQASFIRGVCRTLESKWVDRAAGHADQTTRDGLEQRRRELLLHPVTSADSLQHWASEVFMHFANLSEIGSRWSAPKSSVVSSKVFGNYEKAWKGFCASHADRIIEEMTSNWQQYGSVLEKESASGLSSGQASAARDFNLHFRGQSGAHHQWQDTHTLAPLGTEQVTDNDAARLEESQTAIKASSSGVPPVRGGVEPDAISIMAKFRDSNGITHRFATSWKTIEDAIESLTDWFYKCQPIIGDNLLELVRIEIMGEKSPHLYELEDISLNNAEQFFYQYISVPHWEAKFGNQV